MVYGFNSDKSKVEVLTGKRTNPVENYSLIHFVPVSPSSGEPVEPAVYRMLNVDQYHQDSRLRFKFYMPEGANEYIGNWEIQLSEIQTVPEGYTPTRQRYHVVVVSPTQYTGTGNIVVCYFDIYRIGNTVYVENSYTRYGTLIRAAVSLMQ